MSSSKRKRLNSQPQIPRRPKKPYQDSSLCRPIEESCHGSSEVDVPSNLVIPRATTQLTGAHGFSISGNPFFTNISGVNNVANVIHHGGTHGLEKMETFVSFAARYNSAEQDPECQCHPGTRKAVLERIQNWIDNPNTPVRIFWLHGPAGAGKSAIAQTIARSNSQEKVAATFFFNRSDPSRNDGNRLFTTLALQLAFAIPAVKPFIVDALEKQPDIPRTDVETQFDRLIVRPFQLLGQLIPQLPHALPVIIIDGVDECVDEKLQQRFLKVIGNAVGDGRLPLRFLICSRPEADIKRTIDRFKPLPLATDLAKLDDANRDIEKYLEDEFARVASERDLDQALWPGEQAIWTVVFKSSGCFIFAATVIRCVGDPDNSPEAQLDIILGLKPISSTSPFAQLDELYIDILRRQFDQDFLKTFLALLVGRTPFPVVLFPVFRATHLENDDALLMKISEKEMCLKLRRMRSLLRFEPYIDVYHRSFIDFLLDPSRSNRYHVSRECGITRYLELVVDWIVQYAARITEHSDHHKAYHFRPRFVDFLDETAAYIQLPVEEWRRVLQPLLHLQDKLLKLPNFSSRDILPCKECFASYTMRCLLLRFALFQKPSHVTAESTEQYASSTPSILTVIERNVFEMDLDSSLSSLLTLLQSSKSIESQSNTQIIDLLRTLLRFDYAEVAAKVLSVADAQELMDIMDRVINDEKLLGQFRPCEISQATRLASKLFAKAPVLPRSLILELNDPHRKFGYISGFRYGKIEHILHSVFIGKIIDRKFSVPSLRAYAFSNDSTLMFAEIKYRNETMRQWRKRVNPSPGTRLKAMLAVARAFRYFHSMNIVLDHHDVNLDRIFLYSNSCARIMCFGMLSDLEERWTFKANIFSFGCFFYETYFNFEIKDRDRLEFKRNVIVERRSKPKIGKDAWKLIQRCCAKDPKSRPTIDEIVQEMESWDLV